MRLGLLGGSFDPVHYGHLLLAECAREQLGLDEVWFLPAAGAPHKQGREQTDISLRMQMLELATAGNPAFRVSDMEARRGGTSYTVDTLEELHAAEPERELVFLVGADMLYDLPHWRRAERICELATIAAVRRPGVAEPDLDCLLEIANSERIALFSRSQVDMPAVELSSSDIRSRVAAGKSIRYRTPPAVEQFIAAHKLYQ
ncbi:MAG: nicotinate-nucleotide adenylyltransferase [Thermoguttaceae bacterium]|jgi:nicotinate-nucleotide adenylyltransferase|nr:nicotinate-nucleotide adenylyltransferase [Thermoguttaceae bacterium]